MTGFSREQNVVVVGGGLMGTGIAYVFMTAGFTVFLVDVNDTVLERARTRIFSILDEGMKRGKLDPKAAEEAKNHFSLGTDLSAAARGAALLIESATEKIDIKLAILKQADEALPVSALLATNTSALSVSEMAAVLSDPSRLVGMHFFNPVEKMRLVELVRGLETSDDAIARARSFSEAIGKQSITVNEAPGLATSRMSALLGNEAMTMLSEGVASAEDIDTALRLGFNHPMGPLELGDLTGWDTRLAVLQYLHGMLGERFRPNPLIHKMVKAGRIGRKAGAGVYRYDSEGKKIPGSGLKASAL